MFFTKVVVRPPVRGMCDCQKSLAEPVPPVDLALLFVSKQPSYLNDTF